MVFLGSASSPVYISFSLSLTGMVFVGQCVDQMCLETEEVKGHTHTHACTFFTPPTDSSHCGLTAKTDKLKILYSECRFFFKYFKYFKYLGSNVGQISNS